MRIILLDCHKIM